MKRITAPLGLLLLFVLLPLSQTYTDWSHFISGADGPAPTSGIHFAGVFTDGAVLQKGDASAAVYGVAFEASAQATVSVLVEEAGETSYTTDAMVWPVNGHSNLTWKALLKPHQAQGQPSRAAVPAAQGAGARRPALGSHERHVGGRDHDVGQHHGDGG